MNTEGPTTADSTAEKIWRLSEIIAFAKKIHSSLDIDVVIAHFLNVAISELNGESAAIFLIEPEKNGLLLRQATGEASTEGAEAALRHFVATKTANETEETAPFPSKEIGSSRPNHTIVDHYSLGNLLAFPLLDENALVIGILQVSTPPKAALKDEDIMFLKQICHFSALAVKNAQYHHDSVVRARMAHEVQLAGQIQRRLIPQEPPKLKGLDVRSYFEPCYEMAGDYCHFFHADHRHFAVLMDVSGKGVGAAMVASTIHTFLSTNLVLAEGLSDLTATLNRFLCATWGGDKYATGVIIRIAPDGDASYVSAGHPPMFKFGTDDVEQYDSTGYPLGLFPDSEFKEDSFQLAAGECLCAYSDGYNETSNEQGEQLGIDRLRDAFNAVRNHELSKILTDVNEVVRTFRGRAEEQDDKTMILLRKNSDPRCPKRPGWE